jgi:nucleoside-diphosphate-sugar epimerase
VGPASQTLPLVYVDDVVDALMLAATEPGALGGIFNIVDPQTVTQGEYLARLKAAQGDALKVARVPTGLFMALACGVEWLGKLLGRDVPLTRYRVRSLRPLANFDLGAARSRLGWTPRVGAMQGMARMFARTERAGATPAEDH